MSWFTKAKHLVKLPLDPPNELSVDKQIDIIARLAANYYFTKQNTGTHSFEFVDPYSEDPYKPSKVITVEFGENPDKPEDVAGISLDNKKIIFYPHNLPKQYLNNSGINDFEKYVIAITPTIKHELTHLIDPKRQKDNPFNAKEKSEQLAKKREDPNVSKEQYMYEYHTYPLEFDAKCREIAETLRYEIVDPKNKKELEIWLQNSNPSDIKTIDIKAMPTFLRFAYQIIDNWIIHDKKTNSQLFRIFKMRLYDELFGATKAPDLLKQKAKEKEIQKGQQNERN